MRALDPIDGAAPAATVEWLPECLGRMGIVGAHTNVRCQALPGGVSSDIYRVELPSATICVKRALPKLRVAADWRAPVGRNRNEVAWMRTAGAIVPGSVPEILGEDAEGGAFAMRYLPPATHPVWKEDLRDGRVDVGVAAAVGDVLGRIHAETARMAGLANRFANDAIFDAIRLEPYVLATGRVHRDLADRFDALLDAMHANKHALIHGDFSPKNILRGPNGPVILDAECATFGDPAFDLAFVLNHLLLKGAWRPQSRERYVDAFSVLQRAYLAHVSWEPRADLNARTAALLPALMLARIDGKSPVEYLTDDAVKSDVRAFARALLIAPVDDPALVAQRWLDRP